MRQDDVLLRLPFSFSVMAATLLCVLFLTACSGAEMVSGLAGEPKIAAQTQSQRLLSLLPPAQRKVVLSVYDFQDKTGQHKPNDAYAEYSRAVTQGGGAILYKALLDAGERKWFQLIEREGLDNLLQERKIIRAMRDQYRRQDGASLPDVGPMLYAGVLLEGGIVAYETNVLTGGLGARYLGIGGDTQYRQDMVTVYLRLVSVQSGEVLLSVNTSKTIYSALLRGSVFKFIGIDELLEVESGFTMNEPPQFAVRQAIELAVYSMIMEGAKQGLWSFDDPVAGKLAMQDYRLRRQGQSVPLRDYAGITQQMHKAKMQQQQQRQPAFDPARAAPVMPVMGGRHTPGYPQQPVSAYPPTIAQPLPASVPYGTQAVQGHAQVPEDTRYVPEADTPEAIRRRPVGNPGGNGGGGGGVYDRKVYCTQSGCRAVQP